MVNRLAEELLNGNAVAADQQLARPGEFRSERRQARMRVPRATALYFNSRELFAGPDNEINLAIAIAPSPAAMTYSTALFGTTST